MPLDTNGQPLASGDAAAPSDGAAVGTTQATTPVDTTGIKDLISSFRTELVDFRREIRNQLKPAGGRPAGEQSPTTAAQNTAAAPTWDPAAMLAFRDAVEEAGVSVTVAQRKVLEKLYRGESGVADPIAWVREQADTFGWKKPAASAPVAPPAQVAAPSTPAAPTVKAPQTAAPAGTGAGTNSLPDDPALLTQSAIDAMSPQEAKAYYERWKLRTGAFRHPFTEARERERASGQELTNAAAALRQVLAGKK